MQHEIQALKRLNTIYGYRKKNAERFFEQQRAVVQNSIAELDEVTGSVNEIKNKLSANASYMQKESVCSDAGRMVSALKYRSLIEYDLEREEYYMAAATEELEVQLQKLDQRRAEIEKISVKIDNIKNMLSRGKVKINILNELQQEDDYIPSEPGRAFA